MNHLRLSNLVFAQVSYGNEEEVVVGERSQRNKNPTLLGIIARTDVLREHAFYS